MTYLYFFIFLFISIYIVLVDKDNILKPNINILTAAFVALFSLFIYKNILSEGTIKSLYQKYSLEIFLQGEIKTKEENREAVEDLVTQLVEKKDAEAGELYILARQLKNADEFVLSAKVYEEIYNRFKKDLGGDIIAEYAQVMFISNGRKFNKPLDSLLNESLNKNPNNPSSLTLKGLSELEKNNPEFTIELWSRAVSLLNSEKEKNDLKELIDAVKKRKNQ